MPKGRRKTRPQDASPVSSKDRNLQQCIWAAEFRNDAEITILVKAGFGASITRQAIWQFRNRPRWKKLIKFLRNRILNKIDDIPIAHKRTRLLRYEKIYNECMTESLKSRTQFGDIYELKVGEARATLDSVREEIIGKPGIHIDQSTHLTRIDVTNKTTEDSTFLPANNWKYE